MNHINYESEKKRNIKCLESLINKTYVEKIKDLIRRSR